MTGFIVVFAAVLALLLVWAILPARTPAIEGEHAISSLEPIQLGGVEQWLLIRGRDRSRPVLLFLHGGPGYAYIPFARKFSSRLEEHFVVIHWDQRGAGKSWESTEGLQIEQFVSDTLELTEILRRRFHAPKIYLLGHSWGTVLGTLAAQRHPEFFHACIGLGQVVHIRRGEEISYRFTEEKAKADGNQRAIAQLGSIHPPYTGAEDLFVQRKWLGHYGGNVKAGDSRWTLLRTLLFTPEYSLREKIFYIRAIRNSLDRIWPEMLELDFIKTVPRLEVPVYLFTGRHDYCVPLELVEEWAEILEAPHVEIVWFENSAHNACLEEPERFQAELIERVLAQTMRS